MPKTKLYVKKYAPSSLKKKMEDLSDYYSHFTVNQMIYSNDGIYNIRDNEIFRLHPVDRPTVDYGNYFLDNSYFSEKKVFSQIPDVHVYSQTIQYFYCVGKKSSVYFVVEGIYPNEVVVPSQLKTISMKQKFDNFQITDFYFESSENIENEFITKEVNVILSII